jgi:hypothetical protein
LNPGFCCGVASCLGPSAYDEMIVECTVKVEKLAPLAFSIWTIVLKELDGRGRVRLVSGSYDDVGNALIQRM